MLVHVVIAPPLRSAQRPLVAVSVPVQDLDVCTLFYDGNVRVLPNVTLTCNSPEVCHVVINVTGVLTLESGALVTVRRGITCVVRARLNIPRPCSSSSSIGQHCVSGGGLVDCHRCC